MILIDKRRYQSVSLNKPTKDPLLTDHSSISHLLSVINFSKFLFLNADTVILKSCASSTNVLDLVIKRRRAY